MADFDPGEYDGRVRLAAAVIRSGLQHRAFLDGDGFETWCELAGADPETVRRGIRRVLAQDGDQPLRLYRARPPVESHLAE